MQRIDDNAAGRRQPPQLINHPNQPDEPPRRHLLLVLGILLFGILAAAKVYLKLKAIEWGPGQVQPAAAPAPATLGLPPVPKKVQPSAAELREALAGADVVSQRAAIAQLAERYPPEAETIQSLVKLLTHTELAQNAVDALGAIAFEAHAAAPDLQKLAAADDNPTLRQHAVGALLRINPFLVVDLPPQADTDLLALLASPDELTRRYAAACLGARKTQGNEVENALTQLQYSKSDKRLAAVARLALSQIRGVEHLPPVDELLERAVEFGDESDLAADQLVHAYGPEVIVALVPAMSRNGNGDASGPPTFIVQAWGVAAVPYLIEALQTDDSNSKELAAQLLEELGPVAAPAVPALMLCLYDPDVRVQICAVDALRAIGPAAKDALDALSELTIDGRAIELAVALYCIDPTPERLDSAQKLIEPELPTKDNHDSGSSHQLLQLRPRPIEWLVKHMGRSPNDLFRRQAAAALMEEAERVEPYVSQVASRLSWPPGQSSPFEEDRDDPALLAANVLAAIGPPAAPATDDLLAQLNSSSWEIRRASARALGRVATRESAPRIIEALHEIPEKSIELHCAAQFAIRQIGVRLGPDLSDLPQSTRDLIAGTAPYAQSKPEFAGRWTPPYDANIDPPPPVRPFQVRNKTLHDYIADPNRFKLWDNNAETILGFGEGPLPAQTAAPLLLLLHEGNRDFHRGAQHEAIVHALWRLTRSPLIPAIMVDGGVAPAQTLREMGPVGEALGPYLHRHRPSFSPMPWAMLLPLIGPRAREELPMLWGELKRSEGDGAVGAVAGLTIWRIDENPDVVPELMRQLKSEWAPFIGESENFVDRQYVAWALGRIGPPAKAAVPLLAEVAYLDPNDDGFGAAAAWAVRQIDRQAAAEWGLK